MAPGKPQKRPPIDAAESPPGIKLAPVGSVRVGGNPPHWHPLLGLVRGPIKVTQFGATSRQPGKTSERIGARKVRLTAVLTISGDQCNAGGG